MFNHTHDFHIDEPSNLAAILFHYQIVSLNVLIKALDFLGIRFLNARSK